MILSFESSPRTGALRIRMKIRKQEYVWFIIIGNLPQFATFRKVSRVYSLGRKTSFSAGLLYLALSLSPRLLVVFRPHFTVWSFVKKKLPSKSFIRMTKAGVFLSVHCAKGHEFISNDNLSTKKKAALHPLVFSSLGNMAISVDLFVPCKMFFFPCERFSPQTMRHSVFRSVWMLTFWRRRWTIAIMRIWMRKPRACDAPWWWGSPAWIYRVRVSLMRLVSLFCLFLKIFLKTFTPEQTTLTIDIRRMFDIKF